MTCSKQSTVLWLKAGANASKLSSKSIKMEILMKILTHLSWIKISIKTENMKKEGKIDFDGFWWSLFSIKLFIKIIAFIKIDFSFWCICVDFIKKKILSYRVECKKHFWHSKIRKVRTKQNKVYFSRLLIVINPNRGNKRDPINGSLFKKSELHQRKLINKKQVMQK